jgi:outer membrane protein OmpA-like peptidoglycan-associated protein
MNRNLLGWTLSLAISSPLLVSCSPSEIGANSTGHDAMSSFTTQNATIDLEANDRINRFRRLSKLQGMNAPKIQMLYAPAGTIPGVRKPVPVVLLTFDEGVFFKTNKANPIESSLPVLNIIAENMSNDVPDAAITILGNTDSTGSDAYNDNLSERRALHVMKILSGKGVDPLQMTTVAIGDRQPVAPNDTVAGRVLNRRVEFLISASPQANLAAIQYRHINAGYLSSGDIRSATLQSRSVTVLQTHQVTIGGVKKLALIPVGPMQIEPAMPRSNPIMQRPLAPAPQITEREVAPIAPSALNNILVE